MKSINTLIKLKKQEIDNRRIIISTLEREKDQLNLEIENLQKELLEQQQIVAENPDFLYSYSNYNIVGKLSLYSTI